MSAILSRQSCSSSLNKDLLDIQNENANDGENSVFKPSYSTHFNEAQKQESHRNKVNFVSPAEEDIMKNKSIKKVFKKSKGCQKLSRKNKKSKPLFEQIKTVQIEFEGDSYDDYNHIEAVLVETPKNAKRD